MLNLEEKEQELNHLLVETRNIEDLLCLVKEQQQMIEALQSELATEKKSANELEIMLRNASDTLDRAFYGPITELTQENNRLKEQLKQYQEQPPMLQTSNQSDEWQKLAEQLNEENEMLVQQLESMQNDFQKLEEDYQKELEKLENLLKSELESVQNSSESSLKNLFKKLKIE